MQAAVLDPGLELIVGLGNPGDKYAKTRHNAGFWFLDRLADRFHLSFRNQSKFHGEVAELQYQGRKVILLKPQTYMNHSGLAVATAAQFFKFPIEHILIAHDELDLSAGVVKLKYSGGHGGHNGLRDLKSLGSNNFWRLRLGIAHPGQKDQVIDYVLKEPGKADRQLIDSSLDKSMDIVDLMLDGQMEKAMHQLHTNK
jgi:PTH1 family peptidyl-tRNA hydrolase